MRTRGIPAVKTYRVAVLDAGIGEPSVTDVLFVLAPTKRLAILNTRHEHPWTFGRSLRVVPLRRPVKTAAEARRHLTLARVALARSIRGDA